MNKVILIGNLTRDPEFSITNSGVNLCKFTIAVQRRFANADGERESDFINCLSWRTTADFINKYFKKGEKIACTGAIQTRSYDANDGSKKYVTEVVVEEAEFVQSKATNTEKTEQAKQIKLEPIDDEDLPF